MILEHVVNECKKHGIKVILDPSERVPYPGSAETCLGYFIVDDESTRRATLCCALGANHWEEVLLHEFNHGLQWVDNTTAWRAPILRHTEKKKFEPMIGPGAETLDVIHAWLEKKIDLSSAELKMMVNRSIMVELDCEKRTNKMGKEMVPSWDEQNFIKRCNSYLRTYKYAEMTRLWPDATAYNDADVMDAMPSAFSLDYFAPLSSAEFVVFDAWAKRSRV